MTHQEIKELAGHRAVPPWIMKLVGDAIAIAVERERSEIIAISSKQWFKTQADFEEAIRSRGNK